MHQRIARVEDIDESGSFAMTLATEAEASDGHILSIRGGQIPERMPLLVSHINDPQATAGSISSPSKHLKDSPPRLRAVGQIEMDGEGVMGEIRRDLAHMISKGHVGAVSIRWDEVAGKSIRRVNLPSDHPHFVDSENEKDHRKRWGIFFEEWRALEGSVVAVGADPKALIGRAIETDGDVRTFWRGMAAELEIDDVPALLAQVRVAGADARLAGADLADLINAVIDGAEPGPFEAVELAGHRFFLPAEIAETLNARETAHSEEPETASDLAPETVQPQRERWDPTEVARVIAGELALRKEANRVELNALLNEARGRIR